MICSTLQHSVENCCKMCYTTTLYAKKNPVNWTRNNSADQVLHKNVFLRCVVECVKEKLSRTALIYICDI